MYSEADVDSLIKIIIVIKKYTLGLGQDHLTSSA